MSKWLDLTKPVFSPVKWVISSCVWAVLSCVQLCDPMACSLPGSSVHEILQARILEWLATLSSRGSSWPRDQTHVSCVSCIASATWEAPISSYVTHGNCQVLCLWKVLSAHPSPSVLSPFVLLPSSHQLSLGPLPPPTWRIYSDGLSMPVHSPTVFSLETRILKSDHMNPFITLRKLPMLWG